MFRKFISNLVAFQLNNFRSILVLIQQNCMKKLVHANLRVRFFLMNIKLKFEDRRARSRLRVIKRAFEFIHASQGAIISRER